MASAVGLDPELLPRPKVRARKDGAPAERGRREWQRRRKREMCPQVRQADVPLDERAASSAWTSGGLIVRLLARTKRLLGCRSAASFVLVLLTIGIDNIQPLLQKSSAWTTC